MEILVNYKTQGRLIKGSVHDVYKPDLEKALKAYDPNLYLKWNSNKNSGLGLWEVRMKPVRKTAVYCGEFQGMRLFDVRDVDNDMCHVLDAEVLDYRIVSRIREMDAWANKTLIEDGDAKAEEYRDKTNAQNKAEMRYYYRHFRKEFEVLRQEMLAGRNPLKLLSGKYSYFDK